MSQREENSPPSSARSKKGFLAILVPVGLAFWSGYRDSRPLWRGESREART